MNISKKANSLPSLITLKKASELLGCHPNTLRQWDNNGLFKAVRVGIRHDRRYRMEDILNLVRGTNSYVTNKQEVADVSSIRSEYFKEYATYLAKWGNLNKNSIFVDAPCGTGEMTKQIIENGYGSKYYLLDSNQQMITAAQKNICGISDNGTFVVGDASDIDKLINKKVDAIFCLNGFHIYIDRKEEFLKGCYEILKPDGVLIFDVSTRGINDEISKNYLLAQEKNIKLLLRQVGGKYNFPVWPDENLINSYKNMAMKNCFDVQKTITIDTWMPVQKAINETLKITGRLRPWLPGISDTQRIELYKKASQLAINETGIEKLSHSRVFIIAQKNKHN